MLNRLYPTQRINSIFELPIDTFKEECIKGIIFDIDNTLVPYDEAEPSKEIIDFFQELTSKGFKIALVSNNTEDRVVKFNEKLKVLTLHKANKPSTKGIRKALQCMQCKEEETVIVGDQIFTDVYAGNRAGIKTYLVVPVSDKDEWVTKVKRGLEKVIIKRYEKKLKK